MFKYWQKIDELHQVNRVLLATIALLVFIISGLVVALTLAPKHVEFWLTPQMMVNGGVMKSENVPDEYVHGFVAALVPVMNTWSKAGQREFEDNASMFHYYFTPRHQQLMRHAQSAYQDAQLFNRTQVASLYRFMEPSDIKRISQDAWEVHMVLRITQRLSQSNPMVIADKVVDYHFRVVKLAMSKLHNPFQLALDGYTQPEHLLMDLLSHPKKGGKTHA